jgi:hypothetical protein
MLQVLSFLLLMSEKKTLLLRIDLIMGSKDLRFLSRLDSPPPTPASSPPETNDLSLETVPSANG